MRKAWMVAGATLLIALGLSGCSSTRAPAIAPGSSVESTIPTTGESAPVGIATSTGTAVKTPQPSGCLAGRVAVSWTEGQDPTSALCVHVGAQVAINLYPPQLHEWTTPSSSDPPVATVATSAANQEGAMAATVNALRTGTATISAVAHAKDGAPDPQPTPWRLVITVIV
jgi:hypothetical protein